MTNMELRRKVGYRPRKRVTVRAATRHSARRSYAAFLALGEDACAAAWEMDTVEGSRADSACILTLLHRPSRLQLYLPLPAKDAACVAAALGGVRSVLGPDGMGRVFRAVLTDNGCVPSSKNRQIRLSNFDTLMLTASGRAGAVAAGPPAA
ncbi:Uncharacterised protein [Collinsella aerofaciens]|uniref:Uncharacterized protein n=1 Tax=Collinsella aerofaciens TaxID=74426 RepID=A0A5K1IW71_9ACTN|nr:Uncharacterised protein [Collinsella aerofaciens]